jgi:hypothetical protein
LSWDRPEEDREEESPVSTPQRFMLSVYSAARHKKRLTSKAVILQVRKDDDDDDDDDDDAAAAMVPVIYIL